MGTPNETAIRSEIARLKAVYPWPAGRSQAFYEALSDLWPEEVAQGVLATLRDWTGTGCPAPGYVRDRALAHRSGKGAGRPKPIRGPVAFHEARPPLVEGDDCYLRDAEERYVLHPGERVPARDDGKPADPWVAFMWMARTVVKLKASAKPEHLPFVELARAGASDSDFRSLWEVRRHAMDEGAMTPEELNVYLLKVVADAMREVQTA